MAHDPTGEEHHQSGQRGEQHRPLPAVGPVDLRSGQGRPGAGHRGDPAGRPSRDPGEQLRDRHGHRRQGERGEPEDRGRCHRELGQQIARDRHQTDPGGEQHDDRRAHRLRGGRRGQRLGEPGRNSAPSQRVAPLRGNGQQGAGGEHGEDESITARHPRVVEHQQQNGGCQRGNQRSAPPRADGEQGDQPAGGCPQNARFGSADDDEGEGEPAAEQRRQPQRDPQPGCQSAAFDAQRRARWSDEEDEQDRQVGTGDRHQVGEVGSLERLVQFGGDP